MQDRTPFPLPAADIKDENVLLRIPTPAVWHLTATAGGVPDEIARTATGVPRRFEAPVPGDVHMALRNAGAIDDPCDGDNENRLAWIGRAAWTYETILDAVTTTAERIDLVFHGVDTHARVDVDGRERARLSNMHRTWRMPVPELATGPVDLRVALDSPIERAAAERDRLGARWSVFSDLSPFIRKNACAFGWDWGPALPGAGIWRPVEVEAWSTARLSAVRPTVSVEGDDGVVDLEVELERTSETGEAAALTVVAGIGGVTVRMEAAPGERILRGRLRVPDAERWWPAGLGPQALHDLVVTVETADGERLDSETQRLGFRDLVVEQIDDEAGRSFGITVNDVPLFVRGFNWIPDDTSPARVTEDDIRRRVGETLDLGANLLRVWGGGVFESDAFYRACDEAGVLVWQDFLFACAAYPEEEPFRSEVEAEARQNVSRIMPHPSLALWNGSNENLWFWFLHDWEHVLDGASWGEGFYTELLPGIVAELDPARTYLIGSPSSGGRWDEPNDPNRGIVHWWIPDDYRAYDEVRPRFVSEFGFQGPPARATFDAVVHEDDPAPFSPGTAHRQKAEGGTERINDVLAAHFGVPRNFDEWYWLAGLDQARAVRYGVERFRTLEPFCRGTIVWQLNDCWPALSWSMIDVNDRYKPVAYAVREAHRDRIVVLRREDGEVVLFACNSTGSDWDVEVELQRWGGRGRIGRSTVRSTVPAHTAARLNLDGFAADLLPSELMIATASAVDGPTRSTLLGATDRDFTDDDPAFDLTVDRTADGVRVSIRAHSLLRDATLLLDDLDPDAHPDRNVVTVLPGEEALWRVRTDKPEAFTPSRVRAGVATAHAASDPDPDYRGLARLEAEKAARGDLGA